jgi:hypothetical protein
MNTSRNNVTSAIFIYLFSVFLMDEIKKKNHNQLQRTALKIEKEETHAHRKRATSALSTERTLELRQSGVLGPTRQGS